MEKMKELAVVIPVHGKEKDIQPTLESLLK